MSVSFEADRLGIVSYAAPGVAPPPAMLAKPSLRIVAERGVCIKVEVDLFEVDLTAARQTSAGIYLLQVGPARQIPVGSASRDHPVRSRSKGQMAT